MGADLYIHNLPREAQYRGFEVSKDAVEAGYFRDCYNDGGLFNFLRSNTGTEWSWWQLRDRKSWFAKFPDKDNETGKVEQRTMMSTIGATRFLKLLNKARIQLEGKKNLKLDITDFELTEKKRKEGTLKEGEYAKTHKYLNEKEVGEYMDWLKLLTDFLELAIKYQSPIIWSV